MSKTAEMLRVDQAGEFGAAEAIIRDIVDRVRVPT